MHLYATKLDRYLNGDLDPTTTAAVDAHLGNCLPCSERVAELGLVSGGWERRGWLGRLVRVERRVSLAPPAAAVLPEHDRRAA